jgi:hypothetical protein
VLTSPVPSAADLARLDVRAETLRRIVRVDALEALVDRIGVDLGLVDVAAVRQELVRVAVGVLAELVVDVVGLDLRRNRPLPVGEARPADVLAADVAVLVIRTRAAAGTRVDAVARAGLGDDLVDVSALWQDTHALLEGAAVAIGG